MKLRFIRSSVVLPVLFTIALFILLFLSAVVFRQFESLNDSSQWVIHSQQVDLELERLLANVRDAESGQRGYLITRDTSFLQPYIAARGKINQSLANLRYLTEDNPEQMKFLDSLYTQIASRLQMMNHLLEVAESDKNWQDSLNIHLLAGKLRMISVLTTIRKMEESEQKLLGTRENQLKKDITITPVKALLLIFFSILVFFLSYMKINRDVRRLRETNNRLMITNQSFIHAEEIAGIANWQLDLNTHEITYSENQYHMLGCKDRCFEPTFENFLDFVHPDDRGYLRSEWEKTLYEQQKHQSLFRVIRQDGEIRYIKSIGRLITNTDLQKIMTGINWDITELHLNNLQLEEKNRELETSNSELASFNHIASHDLQEPLRKIQMFVSRILERDMPYVSEASKEAFEKIQMSARHMQNLIDDLLAFSRAGRGNQLFEKADLNQVLENSLQELGPVIDEEGAEIHKNILPTLNVIPFQI
ncbi:MAG: CHASE3 domain-containing protein, partial [Syntrophothermus sp.]